MATNFPGSLDSFTNPTASSPLDSPSHAAQHANINDAMEAVQAKLGVGAGTIGEWTTYTPTWTASATNPTLGNGTLYGAYSQINGMVFGYIRLGIGSTTTFGSGTWQLTLPVTGARPANFALNGWAAYLDASTATWYNGTTTYTLFDTQCSMRWNAGAYGDVAATSPFTWASGDTLEVRLAYEAA